MAYGDLYGSVDGANNQSDRSYICIYTLKNKDIYPPKLDSNNIVDKLDIPGDWLPQYHYICKYKKYSN